MIAAAERLFGTSSLSPLVAGYLLAIIVAAVALVWAISRARRDRESDAGWRARWDTYPPPPTIEDRARKGGL